MRPHYSQSGHENATPFSSTSPLASYKGVPPPPTPNSHAAKETLQTRLPFPQPSGHPFRLGDRAIMTHWPIPIFSIFQRRFTYTLSHFPY